MNREKAQTIINQIISDLHERIGGKAARKQYAPAKHQIATLEQLGIIDLMPKGFGHSDAKAVIEEAQRGESTVMNAYGEGVEVGASDLYNAINEVEIIAVVEAVEIAAGDELDNDGVILVLAQHDNINTAHLIYEADSPQINHPHRSVYQCAIKFETPRQLQAWIERESQRSKFDLNGMKTFVATKLAQRLVYGVHGFTSDIRNHATGKPTLRNNSHYNFVRLV